MLLRLNTELSHLVPAPHEEVDPAVTLGVFLPCIVVIYVLSHVSIEALALIILVELADPSILCGGQYLVVVLHDHLIDHVDVAAHAPSVVDFKGLRCMILKVVYEAFESTCGALRVCIIRVELGR